MIAALLVAAGLAACTSSTVRPLKLPEHMTGVCQKGQEPHDSSVQSVITSTDDRVLDEPITEAQALGRVHRSGGVIATWHDLSLLLPKTAPTLGENDGGYVHVDEAAIPIADENAQSRVIALRVLDHGKARWIQMKAFDTQNPCIEGKRQT